VAAHSNRVSVGYEHSVKVSRECNLHGMVCVCVGVYMFTMMCAWNILHEVTVVGVDHERAQVTWSQ